MMWVFLCQHAGTPTGRTGGCAVGIISVLGGVTRHSPPVSTSPGPPERIKVGHELHAFLVCLRATIHDRNLLFHECNNLNWPDIIRRAQPSTSFPRSARPPQPASAVHAIYFLHGPSCTLQRYNLQRHRRASRRNNKSYVGIVRSSTLSPTQTFCRQVKACQGQRGSSLIGFPFKHHQLLLSASNRLVSSSYSSSTAGGGAGAAGAAGGAGGAAGGAAGAGGAVGGAVGAAD